MLPKRFSVGWVMNWGNPRAWALARALVVAVAAFVVGIEVLLSS